MLTQPDNNTVLDLVFSLVAEGEGFIIIMNIRVEEEQLEDIVFMSWTDFQVCQASFLIYFLLHSPVFSLLTFFFVFYFTNCISLFDP